MAFCFEISSTFYRVFSFTFQISLLEADLNKFKEKWASAQCDLQDTEEKLTETEKERTKALTLLKGTLEQLEEERLRIFELEAQIADTSVSGMNKDHTKSVSDLCLTPYILLITINLTQRLKTLNSFLNRFKQ